MHYLIIFSIAFCLSLALTPLVRNIALRYNLVAEPRHDRWHKKPTALLGGIAIYVASLASILLFLPLTKELIGLLLGATLLFTFGLLDDFKHFGPQVKILAQIIAGCIAIFSGVVVKLIPYPFIAIPLTILWIVGITNSFNILDNMDGLACGVAFISSIMLFFSSILLKNTDIGLATLILAGATLGFLPYNFNPARIFMGDSGSMFLGFSLATVAIMGTARHVENLLVTLAIPVLILGVPIFDTTFVALMRKIRGRPFMQGGKDHTSHRLVSLGLSERKTVLLLYLLSILFGLIALAYSKIDVIIVSILAVLALIILLFFGIFLAEVERWGNNEIEKARKKKMEEGKTVLNTLILNKRRIVEVLIDFILICLSYYSAYLLRFEGKVSVANLSLIKESLPWIIIIRLICFSYFGLYRGVWRYIGITDLTSIFKAVSLSSILSVMFLTLFFRFKDYSRVVFIIDWLLLLFLVSGIRILIRILREYFSSLQMGGKRILIMGAGDTGELLLREIKRNKNLNYDAVGFVDDDLSKVGRKIHGVPIFGTREEIPQLVQTEMIEEILIAIPSTSIENLEQIFKICKDCGVSYRQISGIIGKDSG
jgi:UDP-GlcNAc:undecaprenyl-phosphate GlcNAc-1-phosphate transferase